MNALFVCFAIVRNTATETVEQQLVFTGNEDGKLMTLKNIIRKVRVPVLDCEYYEYFIACSTST